MPVWKPWLPVHLLRVQVGYAPQVSRLANRKRPRHPCIPENYDTARFSSLASKQAPLLPFLSQTHPQATFGNSRAQNKQATLETHSGCMEQPMPGERAVYTPPHGRGGDVSLHTPNEEVRERYLWTTWFSRPQGPCQLGRGSW